jgi:PEP-CTERM motif-containing protein
MVVHRCVITVLAVLTIGTSAAAGPIKLGESGPPLDMGELRASGALDKDVIRALFFRGVRGRGAPDSCSDCLSSNPSLHRLNEENSNYRNLFPFSTRNLFKSHPRAGAASPVSNPRNKPDLVTGVSDVQDPGGPLAVGPGVGPSPAEAPASAPEPGTLILIGSGLAGAWIVRRRQGSARPSE